MHVGSVLLLRYSRIELASCCDLNGRKVLVLVQSGFVLELIRKYRLFALFFFANDFSAFMHLIQHDLTDCVLTPIFMFTVAFIDARDIV